MNRMFVRVGRILPAVLLLAFLGRADAAPPSPEKIFPASTTEFVSIADVTKLAGEWQQTALAQMLRDPAMRPFLDELGKHTKGFNYLLDTIGVDFEKVKAASGGELGWAVVLASPTEVAHVLTLDMNGRTEGAQAMLTEMSQKLAARGGRGERRTFDGGVAAVVVDLPNRRQIIYGVKDTMLIITDHLLTFQGLLQRWAGAVTDSLANVPAYRHVVSKTLPHEGERTAIRFYFEPIARAEASMIYFPELKKTKGENLPQILRAEGVDGIKGVGGILAFQANGTDMLLRAATHIPQPFRGAMRMATLPNNAPIETDAWVPPELSGYITVGLDLVNAYDTFGSLFGRLIDESPEEFHRIMATIKNDEDGPKVDVRADIMEKLQPRITLINDATQPLNPSSERFLVAIPAKDTAAEKVLVQSMYKCFKSDRRFKAREFNGVTIWEYQAKQKTRKNGKTHTAIVPSTTIAVARGNLFISTHGSLLEQVITHQGSNFGQSPDYQRLMKELTRLGMGPSSSRSIIRLDVGAEATYEMLRTNRLDQAGSVYAVLLTKLLRDEGNGQKMRADGSKLPPYAQVSKYFTTAGSYTVTEDDGWIIVGTVLKK